MLPCFITTIVVIGLVLFALSCCSDCYHLCVRSCYSCNLVLLASFPLLLYQVCSDARVSAFIHGASFGDSGAGSVVLSVSLCHTIRCIGLLLTQDWRGHCWTLPLVHVVTMWLPLVCAMSIPWTSSCIESTAYRDCVSQFAFLPLKKILPCSCGAGGGLHVCIDENKGFVSLIWFIYANALQLTWACVPLIQVKGGSCHANIAPNYYCHNHNLWMTMKSWSRSGWFGHVLVSCRHTTSES